jgi:hypothetical protein
MDEPRYSVNDIFSLLREATQVLSKPVTIHSETEEGEQSKARMMLSEAIAMMVANEMTWEFSRLSSGDKTMATKEEVVEAMKSNYYDEVAFPVYENFGISMSTIGGQGKSRTRKSRRNF